jgi:hypothetical protein
VLIEKRIGSGKDVDVLNEEGGKVQRKGICPIH